MTATSTAVPLHAGAFPPLAGSASPIFPDLRSGSGKKHHDRALQAEPWAKNLSGNASNTNNTVLSAENILVAFGDRTILEGVNLSVRQREILALVGPSGCGKSTLLNVLSGLLKPQSGSVSSSASAAYMFQEDRLLPWRTVRENVAFGLEAAGVPREKREARAREVLALVGLSGAENLWPHELSGGMRSRAALARSLAVKPQILLMDEPFSRLDPQTRAQMHAEVLKLHETEHVTIVIVTHDMEEAVVLADRVVRLEPNPGRIAESIDIDLPRPREVTDPGVIEAVRSLRLKV